MITITKQQNGTIMSAVIGGHIDAETSPEFYDAFSGALDSLTELTINIKDVDYVSSAGLRVFILLYKTMKAHNGKLTICQPQQFVSDLLESTGLTSYLCIEP